MRSGHAAFPGDAGGGGPGEGARCCRWCTPAAGQVKSFDGGDVDWTGRSGAGARGSAGLCRIWKRRMRGDRAEGHGMRAGKRHQGERDTAVINGEVQVPSGRRHMGDGVPGAPTGVKSAWWLGRREPGRFFCVFVFPRSAQDLGRIGPNHIDGRVGEPLGTGPIHVLDGTGPNSGYGKRACEMLGAHGWPLILDPPRRERSARARL
jgi:hypothetical protein